MILRISWLLAKPGSAGATTMVLPVAAFGIVTALLLTVIGGAQKFWTWTDGDGSFYQLLAVIALVLLVLPLGTLGGSAARLSARRRDDRLATLRLLGATPRTVSAITVLESCTLALAGAVIGVLAYLALVPAIGLIPFRGEALGAASVLLPALTILGVVIGVVLLAAASAVLGLRRVIVSPLGVRVRDKAPKQHWLRFAIALAVVATSAFAMSVLQVAGSMIVIIVMFAFAFGGTLAVLGLVGPWGIGLIARGQLRRAKTPVALLAARGILESPKEAWRQVSGVAMTSFMAVFAGTGSALVEAVGASSEPGDAVLFEDIRTGVLITVIASFLMVACSVGVNQPAAILDRAELYSSLGKFGMATKTMEAARRRTVMSPLLVTSVGSAVTAAIVLFPLTGLTLIVAPASLLVIAAVLAAGIGLVWLGLLATAPVLARTVSTQ